MPQPIQRIEIRLDQPKQRKLHLLVENAEATWIGFGGSRGAAKSTGARNVVLARRFTYPGTRACILRRTYDLVRENHIDPLLAQYPYMRAWYHVGDKELRIPNGSVIAFRYAETAGDVDAMIGKEYMDFLVDQAEAFTERELVVMKSNVRWTGIPGAKCKFILTYNPGDVGAPFLNRIFKLKEFHGEERAEDYNFIQAFAWDNVAWSRDALSEDGLSADDYYRWDARKRFDYFIERSAYGRTLNALPKALRDGWLLGLMDRFAGQYFDNFEKWAKQGMAAVHPETWQRRFIGIDWGFAHNSACYWGVETGSKTFGVYREWVGSGRSPRALAEEICSRTPPEEREKVKLIGLSHDAFSKRDERDSYALQMAETFRRYQMPTPFPAGKDVIGGGAIIYEMMRQQELAIDPSCKELLKTLPLVSRDKDKPEHTVKFQGDDPFDALKHLLHYRITGGQRPYEDVVREEGNKITDPFQRWTYITKKLQSKPKSVINPDYNRPVWMGGAGG
jgi:hypothetical protein